MREVRCERTSATSYRERDGCLTRCRETIHTATQKCKHNYRDFMNTFPYTNHSATTRL